MASDPYVYLDFALLESSVQFVLSGRKSYTHLWRFCQRMRYTVVENITSLPEIDFCSGLQAGTQGRRNRLLREVRLLCGSWHDTFLGFVYLYSLSGVDNIREVTGVKVAGRIRASRPSGPIWRSAQFEESEAFAGVQSRSRNWSLIRLWGCKSALCIWHQQRSVGGCGSCVWKVR